MMIPIAKPLLGEKEANAAKEAILSGWVTQGPKVKEFEDDFAAYVGSKYASAVSSCTAALHLALIAVGVKAGDVVITVSHSFIATANAVRHCSAEPIFVDINPDTFNMSVEHLEDCLFKDCERIEGQLFYKKPNQLCTDESPLRFLCNRRNETDHGRIGRVAAIMPVHQMGMPCELNAIISLADKFNIPVVEDAACAIGSEININGHWEKIGKPHGDIACFSFHPRKIITTGDGGMITTNDREYDKKIKILRHQGMSIPDTVRHNAKKIIFEEYVTTGYNYRMTDIQAAVGIEQLKRLPGMLMQRRRIGEMYSKKLNTLSWLKLPYEPPDCKANWQSYPVSILKNAPLSRDEIMQRLLDKGVSTRRGIMNAHQEIAYNSPLSLKNSELSRDSIIMLPLYYDMHDSDIERVVEIIRNA